MSNLHFLTGLPAFAGRRYLPSLLARDPNALVLLLVPPHELARTEARLASLPPEDRERVALLEGVGDHMHFGLSSAEYRHLRDRVTHVHHMGAIERREGNRALLQRQDAATANVVDLCRKAPRLERLSHLSSVRVAGDRKGVLHEEELAVGQRFRNPADEACFRSELRVQRERENLPITVFRPSAVIGDSQTGELSRSDLPLHLAFGLALPPLGIPMQAIGAPIPFQVVPSDYVTEAMLELSEDPAATGKTFHLVDPKPAAAHWVWEQISRKMGTPPSLLGLSAWLTGLPLVGKLFGGGENEGPPAGVRFANRNTRELLDAKGILCPPLQSYLDRLIGWAERHARQGRRWGLEDPLEDALEPR